MTLAERLRTALAEGHSRDDISSWIADRDPRLDRDIILAPAAVLVAVTDRPEPGLILTQRSSRLRKHAGQVAFPGGKVDDTDADEIAAALREAEEEIGLPPSSAEIIGISDRYSTFTGFDIVPVIAVVPADLPLTAQADEVADWFEVPLAYVLDPANRIQKEVEWEGRMRHYFEILWQQRRIWGITAAILANLSWRLGYDREPA
ncbi:CoA pyrophosphatase [Sphingobium sp. SCG-1]|uniref:CoA pyrophosphatase n=1 Tax=Sphingobium sp. SCG-1 TaxID=2072936 RepID=UPI000CD6BE65|nr:CoA pyrophosphatase [Sphingobium sp. SCG-1]AUW58086.1 CoA pyrophosphatase [Sphingobium sp. SCG-1]